MSRKTSNKGGNYHGLFFSYKCNKQIQWESYGWEYTFVKVLERDPRVKHYWDQPETVLKRTIDFKDSRRNTSSESIPDRIFEVKPYHKLLLPENLEKFQFWYEWCCANNLEFWIVTEFPPLNQELLKLQNYNIFILPYGMRKENLDFLTRFAPPCFYSKSALKTCTELLENENCLSIADLVQHLSPVNNLSLFQILHLIYHQFLWIDESKSISFNSTVILAKKNQELIVPNNYRHPDKLLPVLAKKLFLYQVNHGLDPCHQA